VAKNTHSYRCSACDAAYSKWVGKCGRCGAFATVEEVAAAPSGKVVGLKGTLDAGTVTRPAQRARDVKADTYRRISSGMSEVDRVFGGGSVPGEIVLLSGEPGAGKSTLTLQIANALASTGLTSLVVSGEESVAQIAARARRLGADAETLLLADETDLSALLAHVEQVKPDFLVVDSVQTIASPDLDSRAGSVTQVHEVGSALARLTKSSGMVTLLIAQVTKDGTVSGPNALAHLVDAIGHVDGERTSSLRLLRTSKNRFGSADEVATFEHHDDGLHQVEDPSGLYLGSREAITSGTCVTVTMEGRRPLLAEMQALIAPTNSPNPRRGVSGLDSARMNMLIAVTERHGRVRLFDKDAYLATAGGLKIVEPAVDAAVCAAIASAASDTPLPADLAIIGEVGLSGEVRPVGHMRQRISEAERLGFTRIVVPRRADLPRDTKAALVRVDHVKDIMALVRQFPAGSSD